MDLGSRQFWVQIFNPCIFQLKLLTSSLKFPHVQIKDDTTYKKKKKVNLIVLFYCSFSLQS